MGTLTGTVVLTTASEPAQQNRRFAFLTTTNTSKKSMLRRFSTKLTWTKKIEEWKKSALASLKSKISCLYPKSYCGVAPTPAQIEEYRKRCEAQAKLWIESQALTL